MINEEIKIRIPQDYSEDYKFFKAKNLAYLNGEIEERVFRLFRVPFGVYQQREQGTYMMRVRCTAGIITPVQLRDLCDITKKYSKTAILHITTRQEVQIHSLLADSLYNVAKELWDIGLVIKGGGGNTVRNITLDPDSGVSQQEVFDATNVTLDATEKMMDKKISFDLPRKFKVAFATKGAKLNLAAVTDIGFEAVLDENGKEGFKVYAAGGLGSHPRAAIVLREFIEPNLVYAYIETMVTLFEKFGNRNNKHRARLRYLLTKWGDDKFKKTFFEILDAKKEESIKDFGALNENIKRIKRVPKVLKNINENQFGKWKSGFVKPQKQQGLNTVLITFDAGMVNANKLGELATYIQEFGENTIRFTREQNILLRNIPSDYLQEVFVQIEEIFAGTNKNSVISRVISCAGASTCQLGICNSRAMHKEITEKLAQSNSTNIQWSQLVVRISGCPNSCGLHNAADIGFAGKVGYDSEGRLYPKYRVFSSANLQKGEIGVDAGELPALMIPDFVEFVLAKTGSKIVEYTVELLKELIDEFLRKHPYSYSINDWGSGQKFSLASRGKGDCSAGINDVLQDYIKTINSTIAQIEKGEVEFNQLAKSVLIDSIALVFAARGEFLKRDITILKNVSQRGFGEIEVDISKIEPIADALLTGQRIEKENTEVVIKDFATAAIEYSENPFSQPVEQSKKDSATDQVYDLRGVGCPMNFVKVKMKLAAMKKGDVLNVYLDDGAPINNVPLSAIDEGHKVIDKQKIDPHWLVVIEKGE